MNTTYFIDFLSWENNEPCAPSNSSIFPVPSLLTYLCLSWRSTNGRRFAGIATKLDTGTLPGNTDEEAN